MFALTSPSVWDLGVLGWDLARSAAIYDNAWLDPARSAWLGWDLARLQ
ncbi:2076_t:CDS:2 [Paraglomus brasilianum]|uniref:2076_t:CDS:1 n=1 Tax=Paraglomus brasilianum TaxID=144538 RepID=A0A9N8W5U5_9GLOM|nr:2076_t:CDS:2 [Paraglomus brasilianum]